MANVMDKIQRSKRLIGYNSKSGIFDAIRDVLLTKTDQASGKFSLMLSHPSYFDSCCNYCMYMDCDIKMDKYNHDNL